MIRRTPDSLRRWADCVGYKPHAGQSAALEAFGRGDRFLTLVCGRRWGKTDFASFLASYALLEKGAQIWVVSKTYELAGRVWSFLLPSVMRAMPGKVQALQGRMDKSIRTAWGSKLCLKSAEHPDSLLGEGLDLLIFDEAATCPERTWTQYLRPALMDKGGEAVFITTPRGHNWVYDLFERGAHGEAGYWSIQSPSAANPYLAPEELAEARRTTDPTVWRQEYEAQFVSFAGQVYRTFDRARHVIDTLPDLTGWSISAAVDPGLANPTAILWIAHNPISNEDIVVGEVVQSGLLFDDVLRLLNERRPPQGYEYLVCDVAGKARSQETGTSFMGWMKARGMHFKAHAQGIVEGINCVRSRMLNTDNAISLRFCGPQAPATVSACENYHYAEGDGPVSEEPEKDNINDHPMDALRYYCTYRYARKPGRSWQT